MHQRTGLHGAVVLAALSARNGKIAAIVAPRRAGKSTFLQQIAQDLIDYSGGIRYLMNRRFRIFVTGSPFPLP